MYSMPLKQLNTRRIAPLGVLLSCGLVSIPVHAAQSGVKAVTNLSVAQLFSRGEYGLDVDTEMWATIFRLSHRRREWGFSVSLPYLEVTGPASVLFEDVYTGELFLEEVEQNRSGVGDAVVSLDRRIWHRRRKGQNVRLGGAAKLPTGDEQQRLSSGEPDFSVFVKGRQRKKSNLFTAQLGFQWVGDTPETDYNDRFYGTVGVYHFIGRKRGLGISARFKQASLNHRDDQRSISIYTTYKPMKNWMANLRGTKGFSDSVADFGAGIQLSYQF